MIEILNKHPNIILFDGVCNFCNASINFLMDLDKNNALVFCPLQSDIGQKLLKEFDLPLSDFDTFVFISNKNVSVKSSAVINILIALGGLWKVMAVFKVLPAFLRDPIYSFIAKHRYKIMGKQEACRLPSPEERAKFI